MGPALETPRLHHPLILVHGLGARHSYGPVDYFWKIPRRLLQAGNEILVARLTPWQTIQHRAEELKRQIEERFPEGKVNLLGHSMGGLDARYLASRLGFAERVASVTTVGTPNRGSVMSDLALGMVPGRAIQALERALRLVGSSGNGFRQCGRDYAQGTFNREVPDAPGVAYFSATSAIPSSPDWPARALPLFWGTHPILKKLEGDNDGFVSVESSRWGETICTYTGDHYGQIGQLLGCSRGLDHYRFFDEILARLKKEGF